MQYSPETLKVISQLLMKYGLRNISMDDIARELGISKKTLYQWFSSKEDMIDAVIDYITTNITQNHCEDKENVTDENAIDTILRVMNNIGKIGKQINPIFFWELNKYYPVQAKKLNDFRVKHIHEKIVENLNRGINEGIYRNNINIDVVSYMYVNLIEHFHELINNEKLQKYPIDVILKEIYMFHLHAIVNAKGREYLIKKINSLEL